ncbi:MAG TPA: S-methyl-5'-thioadenosine phosphorylase [Thermomicrobiales bacterium]|nr:S-methyl-5'-thioadenosine phosphorylase [Thermomicrobiales bacterium]
MLGVIGGSGIYRLAAGESFETIDLDTPFGCPSAPVARGAIGNTPVAFIPRHGEGHRFSPTTVPYRANIYALKALGVTHVVSVSAVGSLREDLPPRSIVVPDQIIDRTTNRPRTFFDRDIVAHVGLADPFCDALRGRLVAAASRAGQAVRTGGTYLCIEGPQFSTRAESRLYRSWGASVIGMTAMPEARLAREAELCYATLALVTDYDVWHDAEADVSVEVVLGHLRANAAAAAGIVRALGELGLPERACGCAAALAHAVMTDLKTVNEAERARLGVVGAGLFGSDE